ncbi:MAG: DUF5683 domain-containing protein [Cytophagaceae bacterium]|nr:DUF5683 domain-containing protein [Cytophagaceae bacterium]
MGLPRILFVLGLLTAFTASKATLAQTRPDSVRLTPGVATPGNTRALLDSIRPTFLPTIIPRKATIRSAILPGLGQAYIKQYWAIPVLYAGFGTLGFFVYYNQTRYKTLLNAYKELLPKKYETIDGAYTGKILDANATVDFTLNGSAYTGITEDRLINSKNFYRRNRDLSYIGVFALWGLNVIEANVSAHLKTFDETDDISWRVTPGAQNQYAQTPFGATLTFNFSSKQPRQ